MGSFGRFVVAASFLAFVVGAPQSHAEPERAQPAAPAAAPSLPAAAGEDWWGKVRNDIAASEYELSWADQPVLDGLSSAWQAPNRAHGFRTYFTETGIRLLARAGSEPTWVLGLDPIRWGREAALETVTPLPPRAEKNRAFYSRRGIDEWYVNDDRGVEQGFTIARRPLVKGERLVVELALHGNLEPIFSETRTSIAFASPDGVRRVHYGHLRVTDASGDELPAWFEGFAEVAGPGVRIVVDDRDASYPVTIDPLASDPSWTREGDQVTAYFGYSVAGAGDVDADGLDDVIVGARNYDGAGVDSGRIVVYRGTTARLSLVPYWQANGTAGANFGHAVGTAGDINGDGRSDIIVGAPAHSEGGLTYRGLVAIYLAGPTSFTLHRTWIGLASSDWLGAAVGAAGDLNGDGFGDVFLSAPGFDAGSVLNAGAVSVAYGSADGLGAFWNWTSLGQTAGSDTGSSCGNYGSAAGTAGDVNRDGFSDFLIGHAAMRTVYLWHGSQEGLGYGAPSAADQILNENNLDFGCSVATAGDVNGDGYSDVVVGAPYGSGVAYVFRGLPSGLSYSPSWIESGSQAGSRYGFAVAPAGDVNGDGYADFAVGAHRYDAGETDEGRVSVYHGAYSFSDVARGWYEDGNQASGEFGFAVWTAGDVDGDGYSDLLVGAPYFDAGQVDEGRAFLYSGGPGGLEANSNTIIGGEQAGAEFGYSVASAGDVNGDGFGDVIVGALFYDGTQTDEGRVFVYHGSTAGITDSSWEAGIGVPSARFGYWVASAGDLNDDGYGDIVASAPYYTSGQTNEGKVFVWYGSPSGLGPTGSAGNADFSHESNQANAYFGYRAGSAGDLNGDGHGDFFVGSPYYDSGETDEGAVRVWYGSGAGLIPGSSPAWSAFGDQTSAMFGAAVASAGDVNRDGYSDLIVGAYKYNGALVDEGAAFLWLGSSSGLGATGTPGNADWSYYGGQASGQMGYSVASAGDVNRNGTSDVLIGHHVYDGTSVDEGRVLLFYGSTTTGLNPSPSWTKTGGQADALYGWCVASAGDVNGDGYSDIAVGALNYDSPEVDEGIAHVYHGSSAGPASSASWVGQGGQAGARYGRSVASAGDIDADGYGDLIVGAPGYDIGGEADRGLFRVYHGNGGRGRNLHPRQLRAGDVPIAPLGRTGASFTVHLNTFNPFGRSHVKFVREVKELGDNFDGTALNATSWFDNYGLGQISETHTVAFPNRGYHWRVRMLYRASNSPFQSHGRWITMPTNGSNEKDLLCFEDSDGDGVPDPSDNCPNASNAGQADADADGRGDVCDNCPGTANPGQEDRDADGSGDACDVCTDADGDGFGNPGYPVNTCASDNCPADANPGQEDNEADGIGDVCDADDDNDTVIDASDNCAFVANAGQENFDADAMGDACDPDDDNDTAVDTADCRAFDAAVWALPGNAHSLMLSKAASANLAWMQPPAPGGTSIVYDILKSRKAYDFGDFEAVCTESDEADLAATDLTNPANPGEAYFYLVRSQNACGTNMGMRSSGASRVGRNCP